MGGFGYGTVPDRGFVGFERELGDGGWKAISTESYEDDWNKSAALLLEAPHPVVWKLRLRKGIGAIVAALGTVPLSTLDAAWDASQRRLFFHIAIGVDSEDAAVRAAADRLRSQLLIGAGTAQTQLDYDDEVDFGRQQVKLTSPGGPLAADAKKVNLGDALADVAKTTEALAKGLGRAEGSKRKAPSRQLRDAVAECAASFTAVHQDLTFFLEHTPPGPERDHLASLLKPLEELLARRAVTPATPEKAEPPPEGDAPA
jgi:hypothetical protein